MADTVNVPAACPFNDYCLGMCEWTDCPGAALLTPQLTELLPSTSEAQTFSPLQPIPPILPDQTKSPDDCSAATTPTCQTASENETLPPSKRGRFQFMSEDKLSTLAKGLTPVNTSKSTNWALATFKQWKEARNKNCPEDPVPDDLLTCSEPLLINKHLSQFAVEARKGNGKEYPPSTIHQLLCGILRYMRESVPNCPNFLDKKDSRFKALQHTLDAHFHNLHAAGIGRQVCHAEPFTKEDEAKLWKSGVLGTSDPQSLQNAAFFVVGKMFCLRGGEEHRALKLSQIQRMQDPDRYIYYETVSKNRNGSFKQLHVQNKVVPVFACPEAQNKCPVFILDKYFSKLPKQAVEKDIFYVRPLQRVPPDSNEPWFSCVPIGKHTLNDKVKKICSLAGITGHKTNHSLRATGVTQMFDSGAPEKLIQERTGHRSLEGLRSYEKTNIKQHEAISTLLTKSESASYVQQLFSSEQTSLMTRHSSFSFKNLHGCTININTSSSSTDNTISLN